MAKSIQNVKMDEHIHLLFILYSSVIESVISLEPFLSEKSIRPKVLIESIFDYLQKDQYSTLNDGIYSIDNTIQWIKDNVKTHICRKIEDNIHEKSHYQKCLKYVLKKIVKVEKNCVISNKDSKLLTCHAYDFEKFSPCDMCKSIEYCHYCLEKMIYILSSELFENRGVDKQLPEIKLLSGYSSARILADGPPYAGIDSEWIADPNDPTNFSYAWLYFDPEKFGVNDYLALPYLLLHEYVVHGFSNVEVRFGRPRGKRSDNKTLFFEGWMDFVALQYLLDILEKWQSNRTKKFKLPITKKEITFSSSSYRQDIFKKIQGHKAKKYDYVFIGSTAAMYFLNFLNSKCKDFLNNPKSTFYQISCDLALVEFLDREDFVLNINRAISRDQESDDKDFLYHMLKECPRSSDKIDTEKFVKKLDDWTKEKYHGIFSKYYCPCDIIE